MVHQKAEVTSPPGHAIRRGFSFVSRHPVQRGGAGHGKSLIAYGRDSVREVKKVVWPTRKEAMQMTGYVFAFVVVMALFLWMTDKTLEWVLYDLILGWKR